MFSKEPGYSTSPASALCSWPKKKEREKQCKYEICLFEQDIAIAVVVVGVSAVVRCKFNEKTFCSQRAIMGK